MLEMARVQSCPVLVQEAEETFAVADQGPIDAADTLLDVFQPHVNDPPESEPLQEESESASAVENCEQSVEKVASVTSLEYDSASDNLIENDTSATQICNLPFEFLAYSLPSRDWEDVELWTEEHQPWSETDGKYIKNDLSSEDIKRQNTIHELYITEKHHCQTLVALKHTYFEALHFNRILSLEQLHQLLPNLNILLSIHLNFLRSLRQAKTKKQFTTVETVAEIVLHYFTGKIAEELIHAYVNFCSKKDASGRTYDRLMKENVQFKNLMAFINSKAFYKNRSWGDCVLLVTQRLSKYHQLVESVVKNMPPDAQSAPKMVAAEKAVKDLIKAVDLGVERVQMQEKRLHIAKNCDSKSCVQYGENEKFTVDDLLSERRNLLYITEVLWFNAKRRPASVWLLLFSDFVIFMQKSSSGFYTFFSQDRKCSIISLKKMIVRDKAGKSGSEGVYLMATFPKADMYEVNCKTKKENQTLISRIQRAVEIYSNVESTSTESGISRTITDDVKSLPNLSETDFQMLTALFNKLGPVNEKLHDYYNELFQIYNEIDSFTKNVAPKIRNNDDRDQMLSIVNKGFDAQELFLKNIEVSAAFCHLTKSAINNLLSDEKSTEPGVRFDIDDDDTVVPDSPNSNSLREEITTTSTSDSIGRSNTFHYVRSSDKRKGLKKHPTVSGVSIDLMSTVPKIQVGSNLEIMDDSFAVDGSQKFCSLKSLLKQVKESQIALQELQQENLRLRLELAMYRQRSNDEAIYSTNSSDANNNHPLPGDGYSVLEELRRLHTSLEEKKCQYNQFVDDRQFDLDRRARFLAERESRLERDSNDLRARWSHLFQVWEHQRLLGLPIGPILPQVSSANGPLPPHYGIQNAIMPQMLPVHMPSGGPYVTAPSPCSSSDMTTVVEPSLVQNQFYPPQFAPFHNASGEQMTLGSPMFRSSSCSEVPPSLQGSLVHSGSVLDDRNQSRNVFPSKLSAKHLTLPESVSAKWLNRYSSRKKSSTLSPPPGNSTSTGTNNIHPSVSPSKFPSTWRKK